MGLVERDEAGQRRSQAEEGQHEPDCERVARDERVPFRIPGDDGAAGDYAIRHSDSSRTTRPSTAERTQSARLPNVTRVFRRLGA